MITSEEQKEVIVADAKERTELQKRQNDSQRERQQGMQPYGLFPDLFSASPFQMMRRMSEEMDRMFNRAMGGGLATPTAEAMWSPRIEAFQKEDKFVVRAELPGLRKEDVEVDMTDQAITIRGQRKHEHEENRDGFFHSERSYGSFYRSIPLPEGVIGDTAKATFRDGVLEITLQAPPDEVTRGRRVEISDGSDQQK
jgi:HSP20 family protein